MKKRIQIPMYLNKRFVDGLLKQFTEATTHADVINNTKKQISSWMVQAGQAVEQLEQVRAANNADITKNSGAAAVDTYRYSQKLFNSLQKKAKTLPSAAEVAQNLLFELDAVISESAQTGFAAETRAAVANMSASKRITFITERINAEDLPGAAAILGAPAYLSGLSQEAHTKMRENYRNKFFAEEMENVAALRSLHQHQQKGIKQLDNISGELHGAASLQDALAKSDKATRLMSESPV